MDFEYSDDDYQLSYDLLKRFVDIGCTINQAIHYTQRALAGETIIITTDSDEDDYHTGWLFDFLLDDEDDFS